MAYHIETNDETVEIAVRRIAGEQIDGALAELEDEALDVHETIHEVRKRCKKIRGLLRLVRPALGETYRQENSWFREAGRLLSEPRDATSMLESWNALMKRYNGDVDPNAFGAIGKAFEAYRDELVNDKEVDGRLATFRDRLKGARDRLGDWHLDRDPFEALGEGMTRTYRRARKAMRAAYRTPSAESFHEWRKRVKYHRYHNRLLGGVWPAVLGERRNEVKRLSDLLGDEHDLALLRTKLVSSGFGDEALRHAAIGLADNRRKELQAWAMPLGQRIFTDKPKVWRSRMETFWMAARAEKELAGALGERSREVYS